jgi:hypothetical protein
MEHLWSPAGATSGKHRQVGRPPEPLKQAKSLAVGCDWLPRASNGKEGVDGSSPSEGFASSLLISSFRSPRRRRVDGSTSTERPRCSPIACAETWKPCRPLGLRPSAPTSTQRPQLVRARARRGARLRAAGCRGRGARSGDRSWRCSSPCAPERAAKQQLRLGVAAADRGHDSAAALARGGRRAERV